MLKNKKFLWVNVFLGDILLAITITLLQIITNFQSKSLFLITGMLLVLVIWQLNDYLAYRKWRLLMS